ncbi:ATP-binding protein [Denitromonas halophila]|uniref:histidine kinase n=1 Tax=Denitromonas halophila TaxID=1629404 RepID=A0A557R0L1_9RHOO|nr:ATP-binding protein [Denitromonas halophila]TVO58699.1 hypothetical protein FHP91_03275 [Denitromonas halophila]
MKPIRISLRSKLALMALVLLALPWVGYQYVQEMERFLLDGQRQGLIATARAVATALHERPQLFGRPPGSSMVSLSDSLLPGEEVLELAIAAMPQQTPTEAPFAAPPPAPTIDGAAEVAAILRALERNTARIWVVDRDLDVLTHTGSLAPPPAASPAPLVQFWHGLLGSVGYRPDDIAARLADIPPPSGQAISGTLFGATTSWLRPVGGSDVLIVAAAHPVWVADRVQGAVVVEESTLAIQAVRDAAVERLAWLTFAGLAIAAIVVLGFASRLSWRIRSLRDEAESAIDARGRITGLAAASTAGDEVGDLSRSFSTLLARLAQHHQYLESMASRLSHELRTPVAVVRSSLENLQLEALPPEAATYLDRAHAGLHRLTRILARMSEATRMEQALATTDPEWFELRAVIAECLSGYRLAHASQRFDDRLTDQPVWVRGAPDLAAQMLDKLVSNAIDFTSAGQPIKIELTLTDTQAELSVSNHGPTLPSALEGKLFDSMVSGRSADPGGEPHLGLGLYVAQLIAGFHGGKLAARNLPSDDGVRVTATLPARADNSLGARADRQ